MSRRKRKTRSWAAGRERDAFSRKARQAGYRSRAAYKLQEIDDRDRLFVRAARVLDLGAAPGGWSQVARERCPGGTVVALDLLAMEPIDGVTFIQGDFTDDPVRERLRELADSTVYDLVICDMSPNITGIVDMDQANAAALVEQVMEFSARILAKNGTLVVKVFEGGEAPRLRRLGETNFRRSVVRKPEASRDRSREFYLVLRGPRAAG